MCLMQRESQGTIIQEPSGKETCSRYESYLRNLFITFIYYLINISYHMYRKKQTVYKEKSMQITKYKGAQFVNFKCKKIQRAHWYFILFQAVYGATYPLFLTRPKFPTVLTRTDRVVKRTSLHMYVCTRRISSLVSPRRRGRSGCFATGYFTPTQR